MTDLVSGAVVQALVGQLFTTLKDEHQVVLEFQDQFDDMKQNLQVMRSFLTDAHKHERTHQTVKTILAQLRELIYDADDILVDCQIRADCRKEVSLCYSFSLHEISFRYQTGKKLREINKRIGKMEKDLRSYITPIMSQKGREENNNTVRWTSQAFDQSEIVGLTEDTKKIKRWILPANEELHRVGIVGMGGLGKTTITQKIFNDKEIVDRFEKRIWVSVSQTFVEIEIMKSMLKQLGEEENGFDKGALLHRIQQALKNKTYLIIMDDVWSTDSGWWERMSAGLPKGKGYSSSIIITTRIDEVARSMGVVEGRIHRPKVLDEEKSWSLFCKVAFPVSKGACQSQLQEKGREIVNKCQGLPLAIKTIAGLLSTKTSFGEWKQICDNFHDKMAAKGHDSSVMASLQLSYDELPTHLKYCILCFSIYPEDCEISAEQLVNWWVGESFVYGKAPRTATEVGYDCLSELISRCLVEVVSQRGYDGRVYNCKMHDMVRDLIIRIAREEAFCTFDERNRQKPNADSRHLGFTSDMGVQPLESNSKLRAFLVMTSCPFQFSRNTGLAKVKSLRVLDLSHNKLDGICIEDLLGWISSLNRLAYLNLRGVSSLKELPYSIRKLRNLQLLVLTECNNLEKLPPSITTLQKLTVLDIGNCPSLQNLPQGLGKLFNLQVLSGFKLASPSKDGCRLGELKGLTQLRVLRINIGEEDEIADDELVVLSRLDHLQVLSIDTKDCQNKKILQKLDQLSPPPRLQELYLRNYHGEATPSWVNPSSLCELLYLYIESGQLTCMSGNFWGSKNNVWKIEGLCLKFLPRLQVEWRTVQSGMPLLKYVEVSHCHMLQSFPCEVNYLGVWMKKEAEESEEEGKMEEDE